MEAILRNAAKMADLRARMDLLRQLDTELHDLVTRPLDEISRTELDAILDRYRDVVDPATRAAMEQLVGGHTRFLEEHAPFHVRRLPSGGVVLATHPYRTLWPLWSDALFVLGLMS